MAVLGFTAAIALVLLFESSHNVDLRTATVGGVAGGTSWSSVGGGFQAGANPRHGVIKGQRHLQKMASSSGGAGSNANAATEDKGGTAPGGTGPPEEKKPLVPSKTAASSSKGGEVIDLFKDDSFRDVQVALEKVSQQQGMKVRSLAK